jgi:hypothetical protein
MKLKRILLVSMILGMLVFSIAGFLAAGANTECGCAETYMGAAYIGAFCTYAYDAQGNPYLIYRHCYYEY